MNAVQLTVVVDNHSFRDDAPSEHGLCLHVRSGNQVVLFDAGKSDLVLSNLEALGLLEPSPEWIVLSHGHYDHTNGVPALLEKYPQANLCFHPKLLEPKWILDEGTTWRYGGVPAGFHNLDARHLQPRRCSMGLIPGVRSSGSIAGDFAQSFSKGRFFRNTSGQITVDAFPDEQVLFIETEKGVSILSGCMHTGLAATLAKAKEFYPKSPLFALVGGLHLDGKSEEVFAEVLEMLLGAGLQKVMPLHCTGLAFGEYMKTHAPEMYCKGSVGISMDL